eukprot:CAMPEP_0178931604 /NCGR_PEP_ID=MMETSP0786-20121207/22015_1 /TAXON_ID=186022 /ORGANISM="Thalassionema frauenfeldii, Strain CCMP 1798" /LENGTH=211 /DNA_ID=CAMNT_0020608525 /DNA_START=156 /DNA_END=791 /DNA_ORIENTATION=+
MHGNVKARNFVRMGTQFDYAAIDLSKAGDIEKTEIAVGQTISGYLPPEHAAKVYNQETRKNTNMQTIGLAEQTLLIANAQYDMWCFGVMAYQLCTGKQLFDMDNHEQVQDCTLGDVQLKLGLISKDPKWIPLRLMLELVLQPNPCDRPKSWKHVLDLLQMSDLEIQEVRIEALLRKTAKTNERIVSDISTGETGLVKDLEISFHSSPLETH